MKVIGGGVDAVRLGRGRVVEEGTGEVVLEELDVDAVKADCGASERQSAPPRTAGETQRTAVDEVAPSVRRGDSVHVGAGPELDRLAPGILDVVDRKSVV